MKDEKGPKILTLTHKCNPSFTRAIKTDFKLLNKSYLTSHYCGRPWIRNHERERESDCGWKGLKSFPLAQICFKFNGPALQLLKGNERHRSGAEPWAPPTERGGPVLEKRWWQLELKQNRRGWTQNWRDSVWGKHFKKRDVETILKSFS